MKRAHSLGGPVPPTAEQLVGAGVDIANLISSVVGEPDRCGCLLVGSMADGNANEASDLDLLLLVPDGVEVTAPSERVRIESGLLSEQLFYQNGIEINIDIAQRSRVAPVSRSMLTLAPALYDPRSLKSIPLLAEVDLRFLLRLRNGIPLSGPALIETWRDEFLVDVLPTYLTIRHFVLIDEFSEDARSHPPSTAGFVSRIAAEHVLFAALSYLGRPPASRKWLLTEVARHLPDASPEMAEVLKDARASLLEETSSSSIIEQVDRARHNLRSILATNPELDVALTYLGGEIVYVAPD